MKRNEWLKPQDLARLQWQKLKRLLKHAYENVPYYRRLFQTAGIRPEDIRSHEDLAKIPITTKSQVQALPPEEIMARGFERSKCLELRTSGSTGKPLSLYLTKREKEFFDIVWTRSFMGAGLKWQDKKVQIRDLPWLPEPRKYWFQSLGIMRREYVPLVGNEEYVAQFLKEEDFDILVCYPSLLRRLMASTRPEKKSGRGPRLVFSHAEILDESTRRRIEDYFQVPVFNFYGMMECGATAWECAPHCGFHINADTVFLEIVRNGLPAQAGEKGRIVATALHSYAMPFIRYDTEDVGVLSEKLCPCGRGLPLLAKLEGRCEDAITLPSGRVLTAGFSISLRDHKGIRRYRIVQEKIDELVVYLVLEANAPLDLAENVKKGLKLWVREPITIRVEAVDEIPPDRSGKLRSVISYVPLNF
ncbi:MAG: hypothetical protein AMS15_02285 [Planctomycetes bacterium DG_23]|nr:MAG: hypothetical protein AMS15_02285 [Planctomycetes bacterium DG_23]